MREGSTHGESLVEVIIAIGVILVILLPASTTALTGLNGIQTMRDYASAETLAIEGVQAVRTLYESNLLKFSADTANCWKMQDSATITNISQCPATNNKLSKGHYRIGVNVVSNFGHMNVAYIGNALNLADGIQSTDDPFRVRSHTASGFFTDYAGAGTVATKFYRSVSLSYDDTTANILRIASKVEWLGQNGDVSQYVLTDVIAAGN